MRTKQSITRMAVKQGKLDFVKLLVEYGGLIIEDNICLNKGITTAMFATQLELYQIADFLNETHENRYNRFKVLAELPHKYRLFMFGLFTDKDSILHTELGKQSDISREVLRKMISYVR